MARLKASKYRERYKDAFSRIAEAEYWVASLESGDRVPTEDARLKVLETIANYADALVAKAERAAKINKSMTPTAKGGSAPKFLDFEKLM
jgi:hypothetical protein